jgi:hypothetical protein
MLSMLKRPRFGSFVACAMAFSAAGALPGAEAMTGGGGSGERPGRAIHTDAPHEDRSHAHTADRGDGHRDRHRLDHLYGGAEDDPLYVGNAYGGGWREDSYRDHRWEGLYYRDGDVGWPVESWIFDHRYGQGDFQPCMHRDVYGDLYQAC